MHKADAVVTSPSPKRSSQCQEMTGRHTGCRNTASPGGRSDKTALAADPTSSTTLQRSGVVTRDSDMAAIAGVSVDVALLGGLLHCSQPLLNIMQGFTWSRMCMLQASKPSALCTCLTALK